MLSGGHLTTTGATTVGLASHSIAIVKEKSQNPPRILQVVKMARSMWSLKVSKIGHTKCLNLILELATVAVPCT
jgi:hypothetical protein